MEYSGHWNAVSAHKGLSLDFIERHKELLNWKILLEKQDLPQDFLDKHKDLIERDKDYKVNFYKHLHSRHYKW